MVAPIVYGVPVQLLAYHPGLAMGTDVDQSLNLAKSVTAPIGATLRSTEISRSNAPR